MVASRPRTRDRPGRRGAFALALAVVLAGCGGGRSESAGPGSSSTVGSGAGASTTSQPASATASAHASPTGALLVALEVTPRRVDHAGIGVAFEMQAADALVTDLPTDFDFASRALLCVYLGERPTTGWSLALQSATLTGDELRIKARETRPGGGSRPETTYPAACGALDRSQLPAGQLAVRADDTFSEEFITDGTLVVPAGAGAP